MGGQSETCPNCGHVFEGKSRGIVYSSLNNKEEYKNIYIPQQVLHEIISHFNKLTGQRVRATTEKHLEVLNERWRKGATLEQFKKVIDNMVAAWKGRKYERGLNIKKLFGDDNDFDRFLNWDKHPKFKDGPKYKTAFDKFLERCGVGDE